MKLKNYMITLNSLPYIKYFKCKFHKKSAVIFCKNCYEFFCQECKENHDNCHKNHEIFNIASCSKDKDEIISDCEECKNKLKSLNKLKITKCLEHDKKYNKYCLECNMHLCEDCSRSNHLHHQIKSLNNLYKEIEGKDIINIKKTIDRQIRKDLKLSKIVFKEIDNLLVKAQQIKTYYNIYYENNVRMNNFLDILINNYSPEWPNYFQLMNIKNSILAIQQIHNNFPFETADDFVEFMSNAEKANFDEQNENKFDSSTNDKMKSNEWKKNDEIFDHLNEDKTKLIDSSKLSEYKEIIGEDLTKFLNNDIKLNEQSLIRVYKDNFKDRLIIGLIESEKNTKFKDNEKVFIYYYLKNDIYVGKFENNELNGYGIYKYDYNPKSNYKEIYEGEFINGKRNDCKGKLTMKDGTTYIGNWKNDLKEGDGKLTFLNGDEYEGKFEKNKMCGNGTYKWGQSKDTYKGNFLNNKKHGVGYYFYHNGDVYKGEWAHDLKEGSGQYTSNSKQHTFKGIWHNDCLEKVINK